MRAWYEELWAGLPEDLAPCRFELRAAFLLAHVGPGMRVLDLGCGEGAFAAAAAQAGASVIGADVAQAALDRAGARHPGLELQLVPPHGPLPFTDGAFEVVWGSEVVSHVADTARWLSEVRRVLAPAGELLLTTPAHGRASLALRTASGLDRQLDPCGPHLRFYTRRNLAAVLREFGFEDVRVRAAGGLPLRRELLLAHGVRAGVARPR